MVKEKKSVKWVFLKFAHFGTLAVFAFFASLPFLWMLITAFKQDADLYNRANNPFIFMRVCAFPLSPPESISLCDRYNVSI